MNFHDSSIEDLSEHYLYFKVFSQDKEENIGLFFFVLLDIECNKLINFDGSVFRNLENQELISIDDLPYHNLPFLFQSIQNQSEVLNDLIEKMKSEGKEHYFSTEDFIEIITHYLFFETGNQHEYLTEYLRDITQSILGHKESIDVYFSWDFIIKSDIINNDLIELPTEDISYSDSVENLNIQQDLSKIEIQLSLDIQPLYGVPLINVKQGSEILVKPIISDQATLLAMEKLQPGYKKGDTVESLWGYIEKVEHSKDKTILMIQIKNYYSRIEELENYVKVKLKQDDNLTVSEKKENQSVKIINSYTFTFIVVISFLVLFILYIK